jgi:hypothetical protein
MADKIKIPIMDPDGSVNPEIGSRMWKYLRGIF